MYFIEESTCDIDGTFRRPGNCAPLVTPLIEILYKAEHSLFLSLTAVRCFVPQNDVPPSLYIGLGRILFSCCFAQESTGAGKGERTSSIPTSISKNSASEAWTKNLKKFSGDLLRAALRCALFLFFAETFRSFVS